MRSSELSGSDRQGYPEALAEVPARRGALTTAIVVSYQAREFLPAAMESLRPAHEASQLECIVVDNASRDGTIEYLKREHAWARVIASGANLGFGRACNLALAHVSTPYVLFLNPDAEIEFDQLATLVGFMEDHPGAGAAAPAIRNGRGALQFTLPLPTPFGMLGPAFGLTPPPTLVPIEPGGKPFRAEWLSGAVLMVRRSLLEELGGFDPRFFLYFEETDLCRRALNHGAELWAVGGAVAHHHVGAVARRTGAVLFRGCIARHYFESRFYYLVKHFGWTQAVITDLGEFVAMALRALLARIRRRDYREFSVRIRAPLLSQPDPSSGAERP